MRTELGVHDWDAVHSCRRVLVKDFSTPAAVRISVSLLTPTNEGREGSRDRTISCDTKDYGFRGNCSPEILTTFNNILVNSLYFG